MKEDFKKKYYSASEFQPRNIELLIEISEKLSTLITWLIVVPWIIAGLYGFYLLTLIT